MAKKQGTGETRLGMLLTLIFFILATFILGTIAYFGYAEQEKLKADAKKALAAEKALSQEREAEQAAKLVNRIMMGIEQLADPQKEGSVSDQQTLAGLSSARKQVINDEIKRIEDEFKKIAANNPDLAKYLADLTWEISAEGEIKARPNKTVPDILRELLAELKKVQGDRDNALTAKTQAEQDLARVDDAAKKAQEAFNANIQKLQAEVKKANDDKTVAEVQLSKARDEASDWKNKYEKARQGTILEKDEKIKKLEDQVAQLKDTITSLRQTSRSLEKIDLGSLMQLVKQDLSYMGEAKGEVIRRDQGIGGEAGIVTINRGRADFLKPGVEFAVFPEMVKLQGGPSHENLKGRIEVVEVTGPYTARCRILQEIDPIRNSIAPTDKIINPLWEPGKVVHVALAARIDLDGDGRDDNVDFIRQLVKQGVVVDAYLDLRERQIKGKDKISYGTSYIIIDELFKDRDFRSLRFTSNDPRMVAKEELQKLQAEMRDTAIRYGVQPISPDRFLAMIGFPLPRYQAPPRYDEYLLPRKVEDASAAPAEPKEGK